VPLYFAFSQPAFQAESLYLQGCLTLCRVAQTSSYGSTAEEALYGATFITAERSTARKSLGQLNCFLIEALSVLIYKAMQHALYSPPLASLTSAPCPMSDMQCWKPI
jgi:hypothetical protein